MRNKWPKQFSNVLIERFSNVINAFLIFDYYIQSWYGIAIGILYQSQDRQDLRR